MKKISSDSPWEQKVGYSRAVIKNGMVFISATAATGADGKIVGVGDPYTQVKTILETVVVMSDLRNWRIPISILHFPLLPIKK